MKRSIAAAFFLFAATLPAHANDSVATLGAGGLVLQRSDAIAMAEERLFISPEKVTVDYVFSNKTDAVITSIVAFPMPDLVPEVYGSGSDYAMPDRDADNFMKFTVTVDGKSVTPELELRAFAGPLDVTQDLLAAQIPLNPVRPETERAISVLAEGTRAALAERGAVTSDGAPNWTLKSTYFWRQSFKANADTLVHHAYEPGTGMWFYDPSMLADKNLSALYCIDKGTARALSQPPEDRSFALAHDIRYVLMTGNNWAGPIGAFTLTVDKLDPEAVVSFCMDGVKKIAPTQFQVKRQNFSPARDLAILVVTPTPKE